MSQHGWEADHRRFEQEIRSRQRNIVFPDTTRNSRYMYKALWQGSRDAPLVQRVGAWLFGLWFMVSGLMLLNVAVGERTGGWLLFIFALGYFVVGMKIFLNGFKRKQR
jgi:hypothetical protein